MATNYTNQNGWATREDWIRHEALIGQLYAKQPLAKVMSYMEYQHGFRATEKMYKTHIEQWGLDKKNKEPEMRAIVRKHKQREYQGKRSVFHVRGRLVDFNDVLRYWERKGVSINHIIAQRTGLVTPKALECSTPLASPLRTPELLATPERILLSIRDYFRGSFEAGTWHTADPARGCATNIFQENASTYITALSALCRTACQLFDKAQCEEAGQTLVAATSIIKTLLIAEHPHTLPSLFHLIACTIKWRKYEMILVILRHFSDLGGVLLAGDHPLPRICGRLALMDASQIEEVIFKCTQSIVDHFESIAGPMNASTLYSRVLFLQRVEVKQGMSRGRVLLQDLLRECEATLGLLDGRTSSIRLELTSHCLKGGDYVEALELGQSVIAHAQSPLMDSRYAAYFYAEGLSTVAIVQYAMGELHSAETLLRKAIEITLIDRGT